MAVLGDRDHRNHPLINLFYLSRLFHVLVFPNISCAIFGYILAYKSAILPALIDGNVPLTPVQH